MTEEHKEDSTRSSELIRIQEGGYQPTTTEVIDRVPPQGISAIIPVQPPLPPSCDTPIQLVSQQENNTVPTEEAK